MTSGHSTRSGCTTLTVSAVGGLRAPASAAAGGSAPFGRSSDAPTANDHSHRNTDEPGSYSCDRFS